MDVISKSVKRVDAVAKVTGKAKYTDDFIDKNALTGKILRSQYAHAIIKSIDTTEAKKLNGVYSVCTYEDTPKIPYPTAGHPYALDPKKRDRSDTLILTNKARFVGDPIAFVVAEDELIAEAALGLIKVEYEVLTPLLTAEQAMAESQLLIHENSPNNILANHGNFEIGDVEKSFQNSYIVLEEEYETSIVQHCHLENQCAQAYIDDNGKLTILASTQIPHIVRRIVGQALGMSWGKIRVIKPYLGGGFGNKQDVIIEPIIALMCLSVHGKKVKLELTREESMSTTRTRHSIKFKVKAGVTKEGKLTGIDITAISNTGAYASHGHSIVLSAGSKFRPLYNFESMKYTPYSVYTNLTPAGAMRGYGVPQICFAVEGHLDNLANKLGISPIELRIKNFNTKYVDPINGINAYTNEILKCVLKGKEVLQWDDKFEKYKNQTSEVRKGIGMACFSYGTGTFPVGIEVAGARISLNQDATVQLTLGATEIGQGADTVLAQIAAETLGVPFEWVYVTQTQDTDIAPFDTAAYASRQTYVAGWAVKEAALKVKAQALQIVSRMTAIPADQLSIFNGEIYKGEAVVATMPEIALQSYYDLLHSDPLKAETSVNIRDNTYAFGVTFAEVAVDMKTGKIEILNIANVHDSGVILNPQLALGQVHGGVSMSLGYALSEQLLFDKKTGAPLNNNLLDYKLPTIMDTPHIQGYFIEANDPSAPYGNKSLGEPTTISPAAAVRNAVLNATGLSFTKLPLNPQSVFEKFKENQLI